MMMSLLEHRRFLRGMRDSPITETTPDLDCMSQLDMVWPRRCLWNNSLPLDKLYMKNLLLNQQQNNIPANTVCKMMRQHYCNFQWDTVHSY